MYFIQSYVIFYGSLSQKFKTQCIFIKTRVLVSKNNVKKIVYNCLLAQVLENLPKEKGAGTHTHTF